MNGGLLMALKRPVSTVFVWLRRILVGALIVLGLLLVSGWTFQQAATWRQSRQFPPPGKMVRAGGHRLHVLKSGSAAPTVILEGPAGASHLAWARVAPEVSGLARVVSYDRAGYGWSDPAPGPRTAGAIIEDLREVLREEGERGPFVLVGHSFGGLVVRLFALQHPKEVAGLVLVDPAHEAMNERLPSSREEQEAFRNMVGLFRVGVRFGVLRLLDLPLGAGSAGWCPEELRSAARAAGFRTSWVDAVGKEIGAIETSLEQTAQAAALAGSLPLGDAPVVILSRGRPDEPSELSEYETALELHRDLLYMSSRSRHQIVDDSGHFIQLDRPEVVAAAIREVVEGHRLSDPTSLRCLL
jgi:pimeloyl-ACP methyl ester carboxylesterase